MAALPTESVLPVGGPRKGHIVTSEPSTASAQNQALEYYQDEYDYTVYQTASSSVTPASTPMTSLSSSSDVSGKFQDLQRYIALGSLHCDHSLFTYHRRLSDNEWSELLHPDLPQEVQAIVGTEAYRLLEARWIRMFLHYADNSRKPTHSIVRVYLLPEDWGRRFIPRHSKDLKAALRQLLQQIDISSQAWAGDYSDAEVRHFDPWASAENYSLFYLFNKLPSPAPAPEKIKNRYARRAVEYLLESAVPVPSDEFEDQELEGLKTRLYPYQARSASAMVQRETAPQLQLDPRLEVRQSPNGEKFFFSAKDGSFLQEPRFYETNRGGILAETMGLGKTIICLAVVLATKGHLPQVPAAYQPRPKVRQRAGSLKEMAASIMSRHSVPGAVELDQREAIDGLGYGHLKAALLRDIAYYEIPREVPRMCRNTHVPPPQQLVMGSGTIIVVPRNLLHQWQSEIRKHILKGSLKILVVDNIPKRSTKSKGPNLEEDWMEFRSDLPAPTELMKYDLVLITRNRFEQEIQDGADEKGRRLVAGAPRTCNCPYIGSSRLPDCSCKGSIYESPLRKIHWLRIIIDEGHSFSSSVSNAVLVAKQLQAERRWVVSGTPAKNLVGAEVDISTLNEDAADPTLLRDLAIQQRKHFNGDEENTKAAKALGLLASNFLMVRPWSDSSVEGRVDWDDYIYRHEHQYRKSYSGFSTCFLRTLEGLVVKTRPDDVEKDITLPPMKHRVVYLKPCWFDKMTANLFIQVLRANAITSERSDIDYLFHKNSAKARHSLVKNLRQANFTWTGFSLDDVASTLETSNKYLGKGDKKCSLEDTQLLLESTSIISTLLRSESWIALSEAHEVGIAVEDWPQDSEVIFSLAYPERPAMVGITQLLAGQLHVDSNILSGKPSEGLDQVGQAAKARLAEMAEAENKVKEKNEKAADERQMKKTGVPSSCVGGQPLTSRQAATITVQSSPKKARTSDMRFKPPNAKAKTSTPKPNTPIPKAEPTGVPQEIASGPVPEKPATAARPKKRKLTVLDEMAQLPHDSALRDTRVVGTTSAKLSYLIGKVMKHQAEEKIIIFYDGDNAAFYIAQCLEMLYVNHRIYARTLDNTKRSEYVALFNEDPDIRVLLIDVACGALGLNLNAASVVLIVNPINRPGIEAQAIKRAHRIGQTKEVLVETLVLEGTIEEAIFKQAKNMSRQQHLEAKELEDDATITDIIQNARVLPINAGECRGAAKFAPLELPQQVFGRPDRHKYHRFGFVETKEKAKKKPKTAANSKMGKAKVEVGADISMAGSPSTGPRPPREESEGANAYKQALSVFGLGDRPRASIFG